MRAPGDRYHGPVAARALAWAWDIIGIVLMAIGLGVGMDTFIGPPPHALLLPAMAVFAVGFLMFASGGVEGS